MDLCGQESLPAEARVGPFPLASFERSATDLNLRVRGTSEGTVVAESALALTGRSQAVARLQLNGDEPVTVAPGVDSTEGARFHHLLAE